MSSRIAFALVCEATRLYLQLKQNLDDGDIWAEHNASVIRYVDPEIQVNLKLSKHLREGFANLFFHADAVLGEGLNLATSSIKHSAWTLRQNEPQVPGFLFENGTTDAAIQALFEFARDQDEWAGKDTYDEAFKEEFKALPECRNDHEWDLVASQSSLQPLAPVEMF